MRNLWGGRRSATWMAGVAGAVVLLVGTSGCATEPAPAPTASASSSPTPAAPVFASDEEALAAATEAYANYLAVSNSVAQSGGKDSQQMATVAVGEALEEELQSLSELSKAERVGVGDVKFDSLTIQSAELNSGSVTAYVCLDVSETDVIDNAGTSVLPPDRVDRLPLEVSFTADKDANVLLLERTRSWGGSNFC